jgi:hypothetical protein
MKTKDFDSYARFGARHAHRSRHSAGRPNIGMALLGVACVIGVFGLLTLLYHFG